MQNYIITGFKDIEEYQKIYTSIYGPERTPTILARFINTLGIYCPANGHAKSTTDAHVSASIESRYNVIQVSEYENMNKENNMQQHTVTSNNDTVPISYIEPNPESDRTGMYIIVLKTGKKAGQTSDISIILSESSKGFSVSKIDADNKQPGIIRKSHNYKIFKRLEDCNIYINELNQRIINSTANKIQKISDNAEAVKKFKENTIQLKTEVNDIIKHIIDTEIYKGKI